MVWLLEMLKQYTKRCMLDLINETLELGLSHEKLDEDSANAFKSNLYGQSKWAIIVVPLLYRLLSK